SCRHDRDVLCDQPRIEAVVLGQHAAGAGELTKLVRVDTSHRQPRCEQGTDDSALVSTARLKANCGDCERAQAYDQAGGAGCVINLPKRTTPQAAPPRPSGPSTRRYRKKRAWPSSYPILADAGSCPGNCSGMEEATGAPSSLAV